MCYIGCQYISDTIVRSCVAVLYWKHEILYDIQSHVLEPVAIQGGEVGRASLCVAYKFFVSISLITLKNI